MFKLSGRELLIDTETELLEAFRLKSRSQAVNIKPILVVFVNKDLHIITLEDGEQMPLKVISRNSISKIQLLDEADLELLANG